MKKVYIAGLNPAGVRRIVSDIFALPVPDIFGFTHFGFVRHDGGNLAVGARSANAEEWFDCLLGGDCIREIAGPVQLSLF